MSVRDTLIITLFPDNVQDLMPQLDQKNNDESGRRARDNGFITFGLYLFSTLGTLTQA